VAAAFRRAGIFSPQQNLFRRKAEVFGKRLQVIEPQLDVAGLEPRQLLLGCAGEPAKLRAAHVPRLAGVIQPGEIPSRFNFSRHV
jgi:hypothetical protein